MAGIPSLFDYAGYSVGVVLPAPTCGYDGILDYAGYSVGVVLPAPTCGYDGILDWTGIPCGLFVSTPTPTPTPSGGGGGGGSWAGGQRHAWPIQDDDDQIAAMIAMILADE